MKLLISALTKYLAGLVMVGLLLFLPAGTFHYPNGWLFCGLLFLPMLVLGIILYLKAPQLLEKRLTTGKFTLDEYERIGKEIGADFKFFYEFPDGKQI